MYLFIQAKITDDEDNTGMFAMLSEFKQALAVKKPETGRIKIIWNRSLVKDRKWCFILGKKSFKRCLIQFSTSFI